MKLALFGFHKQQALENLAYMVNVFLGIMRKEPNIIQVGKGTLVDKVTNDITETGGALVWK